MNATKPFYLSKTFWINLIVAGAFLLPEQYRGFAISPDVQTLVFTGVNILLRLITKDKISIT